MIEAIEYGAQARRTLDIAWAAGFLEGEGFFVKRRWTIGASQVNKEPLERLQQLWGGSLYYRKQGLHGDGHTNRRPFWGWEAHGQVTVLAITAEILPWLSQDRKNRIPWLHLVQPALPDLSP